MPAMEICKQLSNWRYELKTQVSTLHYKVVYVTEKERKVKWKIAYKQQHETFNFSILYHDTVLRDTEYRRGGQANPQVLIGD